MSASQFLYARIISSALVNVKLPYIAQRVVGSIPTQNNLCDPQKHCSQSSVQD